MADLWHIAGFNAMTKETQEKLAASLTAETVELLPFLPYLLQDFWEIGSEPKVIAYLIKQHLHLSKNTKVLDLACGKGAVSVKIAHELNLQIKGIDLIPQFVAFATEKAVEFGVADLCEFVTGDINESIKTEEDYDCVIFGAAGNILGSPAETLSKLKDTIKVGGYMIIDEGYLPDDASPSDVQYQNYEYLTESQWAALFKEANLELVEAVFDVESPENPDSLEGTKCISQRATELTQKFPDKKEIFDGYIRSQQNEYEDIGNPLVCVTWILKKL